MKHSKKHNGPTYESISTFLIGNCPCNKVDNGYWSLNCINGKCNGCQSKCTPVLFPNMSNELLPCYQFERTKTPYFSKKSNEPKFSCKTERIAHSNTAQMLMKIQEEYLVHRYEVENDKREWKLILHTVPTYGPIFHLDYSENIQLTPKREVQAAHFNKPQYSLHCTMMHYFDIIKQEEANKYFFHFSLDMTHDSVLPKLLFMISFLCYQLQILKYLDLKVTT